MSISSPRTVVLPAALIFTILLTAGATAGPLALKVAPGLNLSGDKRFDGQLVSEGIANLVAQEFYDTGKFVPVEEKAEISDRIDRLGGGGGRIRTVATARAEITGMKVRRFRGLLGFLGGARTTTTATVKVTLSLDGRPPIAAEGRAADTTKSAGAFLEVRNDKIAFDATSTGKMLQEAVHRAVTEIARSMEVKR